MTDTSAIIQQLQTQQGLITEALKAMLEGKWIGEGSVEAYLYALNPSVQNTLTFDVPVTQSELDEEPPKAG